MTYTSIQQAQKSSSLPMKRYWRAILTTALVFAVSLTATSSVSAQSEPAQSERREIADLSAYSPPNYHLLTPKEQMILREGEMHIMQVIGGGTLALLFGFGSGHAVQGHFGDAGWKFAVGEGTALAAVGLGYALQSKMGVVSAIGGGVTFVGLRIYEVVHALATPSRHNSRYREVKWKAYNSPAPKLETLFLTPSSDGGVVAGFRVSF